MHCPGCLYPNTNIEHTDDCKAWPKVWDGKTNACPECGEPWDKPLGECTAGKPIWVVIQPGQHIHIPCPVHPAGHRINGPTISY